MTKRWDSVVRLTHWSVAAGFLINRLSVTTAGSQWHEWIGYFVAVMVALRLLWGITFAKEGARLSAIIPTLSGFRLHLHELKIRKAPDSLRHNPIGALAIWFFWLCLPLIVFTGWAQSTSLMDRWPVEIWHEWLIDIATVVVCLHILAVIVVSILLKQDLVRTMLPGRGRKRQEEETLSRITGK